MGPVSGWTEYRHGSENDAARAVERLGVSGGVEIGSVERGSAAGRSGLQRGDVIVKIDDLAVGTMNEFAAVIRRRPPGSDVVLTVWRMGRLTTTALSLPGRSSLSTDQFGLTS